jgi:hypothetical protein
VLCYVLALGLNLLHLLILQTLVLQTFTQYVEGNEVEWSLGLAIYEFAAEKKKEQRSMNQLTNKL